MGWANVHQDGALSAGRNVGGNRRHGVGSYEIAFKAPSTQHCTYQVTLSGPGYASVQTTARSRTLMIETRNHQGVLADRAFYVMAAC